jgi:DNA topoisomerase-2
MGGKDSASERYIFTQLNALTNKIFRREDGPVLSYINDDGQLVEPEFYVPILPMILVNGSTGIGTGYSSNVPCHNPLDILRGIREKLDGETNVIIQPWYRGFKGRIVSLVRNEPRYLFIGTYEKVKNDVIRVTELPIGTWTEDFKISLERLMDGGAPRGKSSSSNSTTSKKKEKKTISAIVKEYKDHSTDKHVDITITLMPGIVKTLEGKSLTRGSLKRKTDTHEDWDGEVVCSEFEKKLGLVNSFSTKVYNLFDKEQRIVSYQSVNDIMDEFIPIRMKYYKLRKEYQLKDLKRQIKLLSNRARFIEEQCDGSLDLRRKRKNVVVSELRQRGYDEIDVNDDFKYLRTMPIDSVVDENIVKLQNERDEKKHEYDVLMGTTEREMWEREMVEFEEAYEEFMREWNENQIQTKPSKKSKSKKKIVIKKSKK